MIDNIVVNYSPDRIVEPADYDYNKYRTNGVNRSTWHGEAHSSTKRDELSLLVSDPKASGNFNGVRKSTVKITRDQEVATATDMNVDHLAPLIGAISFSVPVGTSDASVMDIIECLRGLLNDQNFINSAVKNGEI